MSSPQPIFRIWASNRKAMAVVVFLASVCLRALKVPPQKIREEKLRAEQRRVFEDLQRAMDAARQQYAERLAADMANGEYFSVDRTSAQSRSK